MQIKAALFRRFSDLFGQSNAYRRWQMMEGENASAAASNGTAAVDNDQNQTAAEKIYRAQCDAAKSGFKSDAYVAHDNCPVMDRDALVKLIAFYLPQFHAIPENDLWWGKGFTEWTNVSKAVPQFDGHYQPRLPGELGFYDLRLPDVMRRQIELAKHYGIFGFCFHYYWFSGKRLLELPLDTLLADKEMDFPFCICWANENWTRRWDGQEADILIGQQHCAEGDIDFLHDITPIMNDPRYIRVEGKPLVIVYRPALLPDSVATTQRWREEARKSGLGELFLVMAQFDQLDPRKFGFDAVVEFPPHNLAKDLPCINKKLDVAKLDYAGYVVDYRDIMTRAAEVENTGYPLIRGVFPGWDNEARKPGQGYTFHHSSPALYKSWLVRSLAYAKKHRVHNEAMVFINAWNEWAEGAYLEPDRKYGYAYLDATRAALQEENLAHHSTVTGMTGQQPVLVIIHAYYPEVLPEILAMLKMWTMTYELHVTTVPEFSKVVHGQLEAADINANVHTVQNRGRDIYPFFEVLKAIQPDPDRIILKLHTKKSLHREDGEIWRRDLFNKLMEQAIAEKVCAAMNKHRQLGMIGPDEHVLSLSSFWGANKQNVERLASVMGIATPDPDEDAFVAGSMFWVRYAALVPLIKQHFSEEAFEPESGQVDGTLAHAIERLFSLANKEAGFFLSVSSNPSVPIKKAQQRYLYAKNSGDE